MLWLILQIKCWCGEVGSVDSELSTRERLLIFMENIYIKNTWSSTRDVLVEISMGKNQRIDFFCLSWLVSPRTQPCIAVLAQIQTESTSLHEKFYCVQLKDDTLALLTCFPYSFMPAEKTTDPFLTGLSQKKQLQNVKSVVWNSCWQDL